MALLALTLPGSAVAAPSSGVTGDWTLIGGAPSVSAMERFGDVVYMAGWFQGIARRADQIAVLDAQSGERATALTDLDPGGSNVTAIAPTADGGAFVAGSFTGAGGISRPGLLRYEADGTLDRDFKPPIAGGPVDDLAIGSDGTLYVAGGFTSVGGRQRFGLAAFDPVHRLLTGWNPQAINAQGAAGEVSEIELGPGHAFVAGNFTRIGSEPRAGLAQIPLSTSAPTGWNPQPKGGSVTSIAVSGSTVYLGGTFTQIGSTNRRNLAAVDATGAPLPNWDPSPSGAPSTLAIQGGTLFVGGEFTRIGRNPAVDRTGIAALDAATGEPRPEWNLRVDSAKVTAILPAGEQVYIGVSDTGLSKPTVAGASRCGVASVDATDAGLTDLDPQITNTAFAGGGVCGGGVTELALARGRLWTAGSFDAVNIRRRAGLAALDVAQDTPLAWAPETSSQVGQPNQTGDSGVRDLLISRDGRTVYLGGRFGAVNGEPRLNAAAVRDAAEPATGSASKKQDLTAWDPVPNGAVNALAFSPSGARVYLGGEFTRVGNPVKPRTRLAWVDALLGIPSSWAPSANERVTDIAVLPDGNVFVAGWFGSIGAAVQAERLGVALLAADNGEAAAWDARLRPTAEIANCGQVSPPPAPCPKLDSIALASGLLYASGRFRTPDGQSSSVAALDQTTGATSALAQFASSTTRVEQVSPAPDGSVYILGTFSNVGGVSRSNAAQIAADGRVTGWDPRGLASGTGNLTPSVQFVGDRVVVGGSARSVAPRVQAGVAVFGPATSPGPLTPPTVTPLSPQIGRTLTCQPGSFTGSRPFTAGYEWLRGGQPIPGQTGATYVTAPEDVDRALSCRETASNAAGAFQQTSGPVTVVPLAPVLEVLPAVGGEPWVGGEATCSTGLWRNGPDPDGYSYRWFLDSTPVAGATGRGFLLSQSHLGRSLACEVTATNSAGSAPGLSNPVIVGVAPPVNLSSPLLSGEARVGAEVGCDAGAWVGATGYSYGWLRDGVVIPGASGTTLRLTSRELGLTVACRVTASGPGGARSADSAAASVQALPRQAGSRTELPGESGRQRRLDVRQARVQRDGSVLLKVAVPGAGSLSATGTATLPKPSRQRSSKRVPFGQARARPRRASTLSVRLKPGARARRALRRAGRQGLKVAVVVSFRPSGGGANRSDRAMVRVRSRPAAAFTASSPFGY